MNKLCLLLSVSKQSSAMQHYISNNSFRYLSSIEKIKVGDFIKERRCFSQEDINQFAEISGDKNPLHIDPEFVKKVGYYDGTIVHGALVNSFVSCILGTKMPGPGSIAVSQEMRFPKPLYVNETVEGMVTVTDIKKRFITCAVKCSVGDKAVYDGKATVWFQKQPDLN